jgi:hypothetical protein
MGSSRSVVWLGFVCAVAIAGCGSTTVHHVTKTVIRSASSAASTAGGTTTSHTRTGGAPLTTGGDGGARGLAARTGSEVLQAAAQALRQVGSYSMRADLRQNGTSTIIDLSAVSAHQYEAATTVGATNFELIVLSGTVYLRANARFWSGRSGGSAAARSRARRLANRWLTLPEPDGRSVTHSLGTLAPGTLARCLTEDHGRLTVERGRPLIDHRRAIVVRDDGNAPGATPSTIAVSAQGPPYPLRYVATGRTRPGGRIDICNDGKGDGATGTITLDRFGATPAIQPPAGAQSGSGVAA